MVHRSLKWLATLLLAPPVLAVLYLAIFGWNWARAPLQRMTLDRTGRELVIGGDLKVSLGWPAPRVHATAVTFANPPWAKEKQMIAVDDVELTVNLLELLRKNLVFPEVRLTRQSSSWNRPRTAARRGCSTMSSWTKTRAFRSDA